MTTKKAIAFRTLVQGIIRPFEWGAPWLAMCVSVHSRRSQRNVDQTVISADTKETAASGVTQLLFSVLWQNPCKGQLQEGRISLGSGFEGRYGGRNMRWLSHCTDSQETDRWILVFSSPSLFYSYKDPSSHENVSHISRVDLPISVSII